MPTLLDESEVAALQYRSLDEPPVEEFDLERLALLSAPPAIEPPRFALLEPSPRFGFRRTVAVGFLAALIVTFLGTLRPAARATYVPTAAAQTGAASAGSAACPLD